MTDTRGDDAGYAEMTAKVAAEVKD